MMNHLPHPKSFFEQFHFLFQDLVQLQKLNYLEILIPLKHSESMIFLKDGRYFDKVIEVLKESGFPDESIFAIGQDLGTENEIIRKMTLGEVNDESLTTKYFSILVVKRV